MKKNYMFYVVDPIAESVIGSFTAISDDMAKKIVEKAMTDDRLKHYGKDYEIYRADGLFETCETYGEVVSCCSHFISGSNVWDSVPAYKESSEVK